MAKARKYIEREQQLLKVQVGKLLQACVLDQITALKNPCTSQTKQCYRRRVLFKPPTSKTETPLSRSHLLPWSSAPTTPPTAPCLCPLHRCWLTHQQGVEQLEHAQYNVLAASGSDGDHRGWKIICGLHSRPPSDLCLERRFWKIWRAHWRLPSEGDNYYSSMCHEIVDLWGATRSQREQSNSPKERTW